MSTVADGMFIDTIATSSFSATNSFINLTIKGAYTH
jgi:hypothetical protein